VDPADRLGEMRAVLSDHARTGDRDRTAPRPLLARPVHDHHRGGLRHGFALVEEGRKVLEDRVLQRLRPAAELPRLVTPYEAEQATDLAVLG
jgi:hypothetical protein